MKLYNTPLEIGFRALVIMREFVGQKLEMEKLMYLDFLCLNTSDIGGPPSLAAPIPNRGVQVFARKELLQKGMTILLSKELVDFSNDTTGFSLQTQMCSK